MQLSPYNAQSAGGAQRCGSRGCLGLGLGGEGVGTGPTFLP